MRPTCPLCRRDFRQQILDLNVDNIKELEVPDEEDEEEEVVEEEEEEMKVNSFTASESAKRSNSSRGGVSQARILELIQMIDKE